MRKATWIATIALLVVAASAHAGDKKAYFGKHSPPGPAKKVMPAPSRAPMPPGILQGGDTFGSATPIGGIPFSDVGETCSYADDYYPSCAYFGISTAPDVVYTFTPATDMCVSLSLCGSSYDTILHVYAGNAATMVGCNDDDPDGNCGLQSVIPSLNLLGGVTYYIVVDGYSTDCGEYVLSIDECPPPCVVECPPGSLHEGEPDCADNYEDTFNGGCNSDPAVFSPIECNDTGAILCGKFGTYDFFGSQYRDTDWYKITVASATHLVYCLTAEADPLIAILDGNAGCPADGSAPPILCFQFGTTCQQVCCEADLAPGTYYLFAATADFSGVPCGTDYVMSVAGNLCPPVGVQPTQWGKFKELYR